MVSGTSCTLKYSLLVSSIKTLTSSKFCNVNRFGRNPIYKSLYITYKYHCQKFIKTCRKKYTNPIIGILGISSGGYYALRLKKMIPRLQFCIGVAPVINPQRRKQLLQQLPSSKLTQKLKQVIRATPSVRKIYNKIDSETLIIVSRKDIQVPLEIFDEYQIPNLIILEKQDHSITQQVNLEIMTKINQFLTEVNQP